MLKKVLKSISSQKHVAMANLFFEAGYLAKIHRSQRKSNPYSIAEHSYRVMVIAYVLGKQHSCNLEKVLVMSMFHDLPETRIGDLDFVHRRYIPKTAEIEALTDATQAIPQLDPVAEYLVELNHGKTIEAKIVRDADCLEEMVTEKEQLDAGDPRANDWLEYSLKHKKLETKLAQTLAHTIATTHSDAWWHHIIHTKP